jgi:hypothetical protein
VKEEALSQLSQHPIIFLQVSNEQSRHLQGLQIKTLTRTTKAGESLSIYNEHDIKQYLTFWLSIKIYIKAATFRLQTFETWPPQLMQYKVNITAQNNPQVQQIEPPTDNSPRPISSLTRSGTLITQYNYVRWICFTGFA